MKKFTSVFPLVALFFLLSLTSCQVVEGIFNAGFWVGILAVVGIIALILFFLRRR
ncbi:MAG: phosphatidate cytidylyltransferase [Weeksellaceae bacterium]|nr:phosphatidate cytidylyltransferase [Weeksellaceae bacterium]